MKKVVRIAFALAALLALSAGSPILADPVPDPWCWTCQFEFWVGEDVCAHPPVNHIAWAWCEMPESGGCRTYMPFCEVIIVT